MEMQREKERNKDRGQSKTSVDKDKKTQECSSNPEISTSTKSAASKPQARRFLRLADMWAASPCGEEQRLKSLHPD